jgi:hypothetical protein
MGKPEGKRTLERQKRRWEDNITMHLRNRIEWYGLVSSGSGYRPVAGSCEHGNEPSVSIIRSEFRNTNSFLKDWVP